MNGNVEGRNRLVRYDELGVHRQSARDTDSLALSAAELMGITVVVIFSQTDLIEQFYDSIALGLAFGELMNLESFTHDVAHAHARVERGVGILKDDLHLPPRVAQLAR